MAKLARFSISLDQDLLQAFDTLIAREGYPTRSEAVKHLIRGVLVDEEWQGEGNVAGAVLLVYDHHKPDVIGKLVDIQHDHMDCTICTQHVHLDHNNCLEIVTVRGPASQIRQLLTALRSVKGIKHATLLTTTTGSTLP